jgi:transposase
MRILKAILGGERNVENLGAMRDRNCKATAEVIAQSLVGNYRQEHLFALKQAVELFEIYQEKITECEAEMENYLRSLSGKRNDALPPLGESRKRQRMSFNVRDYAYRLTGVDLFRVKGFNSQTVLQIISEVGVDLSGFASEKQFASWLSVSPNRRISGGKVLSSRTKASNNRAAQAFRQAAVSVARSESELGTYYRRMQARKGPAAAITATAHKMARLYYSLVKQGQEYEEGRAEAYQERQRERAVSSLRKRAKGLGYELVEVAA